MTSADSASGDFDYENAGDGYERFRRADGRIAAQLRKCLGGSRTVLNVGAGAGSYEMSDRYTVAVEPSAVMRARRPRWAVPALNAQAQALPFDTDAFDASTAIFTVHQWASGLDEGLAEVRRVTRGPIVIMTLDVDQLGEFWLTDYFPQRMDVEGSRFPSITHLTEALGGTSRVEKVPIPQDCTDGFVEAYYARPESYLDPEVRAAQSLWNFLDPDVVERGLTALAADLAAGVWDTTFGRWRTMATYSGPLVMVVVYP